MMQTLLLILGLAMFVCLVITHELGHFVMARRGGVVVEEFGLGFPPAAYKRRTKKGWVFSLNILPLGGFVKLKGEHDTDTDPGTFGAASVATKAKIMVAGVVVNLLTAYLLLVFLAFVGMPQLLSNQFTIKSDTTYVQRVHTYVVAGKVESNSPAAQAGLRTGDEILALGMPAHLIKLSNVNSLPTLTHQYAGQTVEVKYQHGTNGKVVEREVTLRSLSVVQQAQAAGKQIGYLGLSAGQEQSGFAVVRSTWSAPIVAAGLIKQLTALTFEGLGKAIAGVGGIISGTVTGNAHVRQAGQTEASSQVTGPVGIFFVLKYSTALGYRFVVFVVALISLSLAIMNILPIPALDGGRLWLMLVTRALRKPLSPMREEAITAAGFAFLMSLVILITIVDVKRFF